jgi:ketosteroid isomerase-like protein
MVENPVEINGAGSKALIPGPVWVNPAPMLRPARALFALVLLSALPGRAEDAASPDEAALRQLNADYVRAFLTCDVERFRSLLADDFTGVLANGRVIDKAEFLREAKEPPDAKDLRLHGVVIRVYGDTALVGATVTYTRSGGASVQTRYSTLYARRAGRWAVVWVQWTRVVGPAN